MGSKTPFPLINNSKWTIERVTAYPELIAFLDEIQRAVDCHLIHHEVLKHNEHFAGYITVNGRSKDKIPHLRKHIMTNHPKIQTELSPMSEYSFLYKFEIPDGDTR